MTARLALAAATLAAAALPAHATLVISTAPSSNVTCISGTCSATNANAVLNVRDLKALLQAGDLTVTSAGVPTDMAFEATLNWTRPHRLTLDAGGKIVFTMPVTSEGKGGVTLISNDHGQDPLIDYAFVGKGKLAFWDTASSLVINGKSFALVGDLATLAAGIAANPSGAFALAKGYDASADGVYAHAPIRTAFGGTFEGLGHAVMNLSVSAAGDTGVGLFAATNGATLRDIGLTNVSIAVDNVANTGALVGDAELVTIEHGYSTGRITGSGGDAGGLVGHFENLETREDTYDVWSDASVSGSFQIAGGLFGEVVNPAGTIQLVHATGAVTARQAQFVGGLVGSFEGGLEQAYATGAVIAGRSSAAGGLIGDGFTVVADAFATGNVSAGPDSEVGGFAGDIGGSLVDTYATGAVKVQRNHSAGGLVGTLQAGANIEWGYAIGDLSEVKGGATAGGLIGMDSRSPGNGKTVAMYWDLDTTGVGRRSKGAGNIPRDPGLTGLTTAQFLAGLPDGFDPAAWAQSPAINGGYPYLIYVPPPQ
jgi:hypothetical protein